VPAKNSLHFVPFILAVTLKAALPVSVFILLRPHTAPDHPPQKMQLNLFLSPSGSIVQLRKRVDDDFVQKKNNMQT
jgi:hypothetical protein